jgi:hypothetical protein
MRDAQARVQGGVVPLPWPDVLPALYREQLQSRQGLANRLETFIRQFSLLNQEERELVIRSLHDQNEIVRLLARESDCLALDELPAGIRDELADLFDFAFTLLTDLGTRDDQYRRIYSVILHRICPFCGCEYFAGPSGPREDLDHYLVKSKYPMAAVNLRNLVPMGRACNSKYKLARDVLRSEDDLRRRAFDPYGEVTITISLARSRPFGGTKEQLPAWEIDFIENSEEAATWNEVFRIKERYINDILDPEFLSWLRTFGHYSKSMNLEFDTDQRLLEALRRFVSYQRALELQERAFLRAEVFTMLLSECEQGNDRLIALLRHVIALC